MKKITKQFRDGKVKVTIGFIQEVKWREVNPYGGPKEDGPVLVSNGDGKAYTLYNTGDNSGKNLFDDVMERIYEDVTFSDNDEVLSSDDLIKLYKQYYVWYDIKEDWSESGQNNKICSLVIYRGKDIPKYFLETKLVGPIDTEVDNYEEIIE